MKIKALNSFKHDPEKLGALAFVYLNENVGSRTLAQEMGWSRGRAIRFLVTAQKLGLTDEPKTPKKAAKGIEDNPSPLFLRAWEDYPRRTGHSKALAWKAWGRWVKAGKTEGWLLHQIHRYKDYVKAQKTEEQFIKHMSSLLSVRDQHIENDYTPSTTPPSNLPAGGPIVPSAEEINKSLI